MWPGMAIGFTLQHRQRRYWDEGYAALSLLTLYGGLLVKGFPYTVLDLSRREIYLVRWPVYGYFTVLFKCFVLIMSLLLGFALRERKDRSLNEEEKYTDRHKYNEKKVLKYLTKNDTVTGIGLLLFCAASLAFFTYMFLSDTSTDWNFQAFFPLLLIGSLFVMLGAFGAVSLYRGLRPQTSMAYRQLLAMGTRIRCWSCSARRLWTAARLRPIYGQEGRKSVQSISCSTSRASGLG